MRCTPILIVVALRSSRIRSRPQQNKDRWSGQYSLRRSLIGYLEDFELAGVVGQG